MPLPKKLQKPDKEQPLVGVSSPSKKSLQKPKQRKNSAKKLQILKGSPMDQGDGDSSAPDLSTHVRSKKLLIPQQKNVETLVLVKPRKKSATVSNMVDVFGRPMDCTKYNKSTPLYSLCRDWMSNQSRNTVLATTKTAAKKVTVQQREDNADEVLAQLISGKLKMLTLMPQARSTDLTGVPPPLDFTEMEKIQEENPNGFCEAELLATNVARWKSIRKHWQEHARQYNHERYERFDQIMNAVMQKKPT